jgi:hypothetical protein
MSLRMIVVDSRFCLVRGSVSLAAKACSKALLAFSLRHGKSPCFLKVAFLLLFGVDARALKVASLNGANSLECAYCHGE